MIGRWLRMRLNKRVLDELYARRAELARALRDSPVSPFRPTVGYQHTQGMYDGINHAINLMETEYR